MIEIEKNVPIPTANRKSSEFDLFEPGDSAFFPAADAKKTREAVYRYAIMKNKRFVTRTVDNGLRIWRIE